MITENGQPDKADTFTFLESCCRRVSETYGKPDWDCWTNGDFVRLGYILFRQTHVRISPNTLKRIFGKIKTDSRYYPQKATRDALAIYIGHSDWDHFVATQTWNIRQAPPLSEALVGQATLSQSPVIATLPGFRPPPSSVRNWGLPIRVGGGLLGVILALVCWHQYRFSNDSAQLICRNPTGENPHSAVFQFKSSNALFGPSGVYTILFGDGKRQTINANDSLYTHYYELPGRYFALLQRDGVTLDTATVYLQTHGWTVTASMMHDTTRVYPISIARMFANGKRHVSALEAARAGVDTNRTFFVEFANSQPTQIDGDNFELVTRVRTSADRAGVRCSQVGIMVWGESSQHMFDIMKPGCTHWVRLQNSERIQTGERDDLGFLGADLQAGGTLALKVIDKQVSIFINKRRVYTTAYTQPLHRIYGVKIRFAGIGMVDSFVLKDTKTGTHFDGSF